MRYASFIAVAVLTFFAGLLVHFAIQPNVEIPSLAETREDQWHKLYEAAAISGDGALRTRIQDSLMCFDVINEPNGRMVYSPDNRAYCLSADGRTCKLQYLTYPSTFERITKSQVAWSVRNLDFVRSISNKDKARQYVEAHLAK